MRKLAAIVVLGAAVAVPVLATGGADAQTAACPGQSTYLPDQATSTTAAAITAATSAVGHITTGGTVRVSFTSSTCGSLRIVLRAKEIRPGDKGYPRHDGFTTLTNILTRIPAGPTNLTFTLTTRGLDLLKYARSSGQPLTVFVIVHVRPAGARTSSEAIQIVSVT